MMRLPSNVVNVEDKILLILRSDIEVIKKLFNYSEGQSTKKSQDVSSLEDEIISLVKNGHNSPYYYVKLLEHYAKTRPKQNSTAIVLLNRLISVFQKQKEEIIHYIKNHTQVLAYHMFPRERTSNDDSQVFNFLRNDSIDQFVSFLFDNPTFDIRKYQSTEGTIYQLYFLTSSISLLDFCCLFGSIKCFKYLLVNGCKPTKTTCTYAVKGGNNEIIASFQQQNNTFRHCLKASIQYHRYDITDWIIQNNDVKKIPLHATISAFNYEALIFYYRKGESIEETDKIGKNSLLYAFIIGHTKLASFLLEKMPFQDKDIINTLLHQACKNGHHSLVQYLIEKKGADKEEENEEGKTPLHVACQEGYIKIVEYLINIGANIEKKTNKNYSKASSDDSDSTPLIIACKNGNLSVVDFLLKKGARIDAKDAYLQSPLIKACESGHLPVVQLLVKVWHANVNDKVSTGKTPLHFACEKGHLPVVKWLIQNCDVDIEAQTTDKETPLHLACEMGHLSVVKYLIEKANANISAKTHDFDDIVQNGISSDEFAPVHLAAIFGTTQIVQYFIEERGINKEQKTKNGLTILMLAAREGQLEVVKYLIEDAGAGAEEKTPAGLTPLSLAIANNQLDIVKYLIEEAQVNVELKDPAGRTPLFRACEYGYIDIVKYLIESAHANSKTFDNFHFTLLHISCVKMHNDIANYLIDKQLVDFNAIDRNRRTALDYAISGNMDEVVISLKSYTQPNVKPYIHNRAVRMGILA